MKTTPIKEIIFKISFREQLGMECLDKFKEDAWIKDVFDHCSPGFNTNVTAKGIDQPPKTEVKQSGYIFKCDAPCDRVLQTKIGSLAFHKIRSYEKYEVLIEELNNYWTLLQTCSQTLTVSNISLRYINFIEMEEGEELTDKVTIITNHPFDDVKNDFNQVRFSVGDDMKTECTVVVSNATDRDKKGVVLDITVNRKIDSVGFEKIEEAFLGMRETKNDVFFKSITEKAYSKYEQ